MLLVIQTYPAIDDLWIGRLSGILAFVDHGIERSQRSLRTLFSVGHVVWPDLVGTAVDDVHATARADASV